MLTAVPPRGRARQPRCEGGERQAKAGAGEDHLGQQRARVVHRGSRARDYDGGAGGKDQRAGDSYGPRPAALNGPSSQPSKQHGHDCARRQRRTGEHDVGAPHPGQEPHVPQQQGVEADAEHERRDVRNRERLDLETAGRRRWAPSAAPTATRARPAAWPRRPRCRRREGQSSPTPGPAPL